MKANNPLIDGRRADSDRRRQRVLQALEASSRTGEDITVSNIARQARVDRTFLYRHRDLLARIHAAQTEPNPPADRGPAVSRASLAADLANAQERNGRLHTRVQQLERKLSEVLGDRAWQESGLGAPDDIEQLKFRIVNLEQQVSDLTRDLHERTAELDAARAANRQLMSQVNINRS